MFIVNLSQDKSKLNPYISNTLLTHIQNNLQKKNKTILYLNKRGSFSSLICNDCQHIHQCPQCDVSLAIHESNKQMVCHICGSTQPLVQQCQSCKSDNLVTVGVGTQQIESSLKSAFPHANLFRLDTDAIKNKSQKQQTLQKLNDADIIIGTKMITTGFNIPHLGLIGVILLEQELQIPVYNTEERLYENIVQLIGRGNRVHQKTDILLQTFIPENTLIQDISQANYKEFFINCLKERKLFGYPPYQEYLHLEYRNKDEEKSKKFIQKIHEILLKNNTKNDIFIQLSPRTQKKNNQFFHHIILKGKNLRDFLGCIKTEIFKNPGLQIIFFDE